MANLIMNAFAFKDTYRNSPQLGGNANSKTIDVYMKNIYVSLKSAKINNPLDDVALITNMEIPLSYRYLFEENNIKIFIVPFDDYILPSNFVWALAFFKLCAIDYMVNNYDYEHYLLIDADTIVVDCLTNVWKEVADGVMLMNTAHSLEHKERQLIINDYKKLYGSNKNIVHYGGELIAGTKKNIIDFLLICKKVYELIKSSNFDVAPNIGDETITSIAAYEYNNIISAQPYIYRYWTGRFYLVSTNYINNPVKIWHLPSEKETGMLDVYDYLLRKKELPDCLKLRKMVGLPKATRNITFRYIIERTIKKIKS